MAKNLDEMREQAYGDAIYKANSDKSLGVIIINTYDDRDEEAEQVGENAVEGRKAAHESLREKQPAEDAEDDGDEDARQEADMEFFHL